MTVLLTGGGTVAVVAGGLVTVLALVRLILMGGGEADTDADSPATERVDRIAAAIALALLGVALIALGFLWG